MSLRARLLLVIFSVNIVLFVVLVALTFQDFEHLRKEVRRQWDERSDALVRGQPEIFLTIGSFERQKRFEPGSFLDKRWPREFIRDLAIIVGKPIVTTVDRRLIYATIWNPLGATRRKPDFDYEKMIAIADKAFDEGKPQRVGNYEDDWVVPFVASDTDERLGVIYIAQKLPELEAPDSVLSPGLITWVILGATFILGFLAYWTVSRIVIRPVERLTRATRQMARGELSEPIQPTGSSDEIADMVDTFNVMVAEIQDYRTRLEERIAEATQKIQKTEANLAIAQRLAATGTLAAGIAHEINNPLGGMLNAAVRVRDREDLSERGRDYVNLIIDGLGRIEQTVGQVLRFAPRPASPERVSLRTVVQRALDFLAHRVEKSGVVIECDYPQGDDLAVFGEPRELGQSLLNILINAVDASQPGRVIRIVGQGTAREVSVVVEDEGEGMTEEQLQNAFDLFYTTKDVGKGTGLGLSIAHNIVQSHGGRIEIQSERGRGTRVEIVLPRDAGR
ncbi:MAG: ATP-binding protein [Planctomycetota bacterium]